MNLLSIFGRDTPIPELTAPHRSDFKVEKKAPTNMQIEKSKEKWRKLVENKYKKSILNKTYKFPRQKENQNKGKKDIFEVQLKSDGLSIADNLALRVQ